jgi:Holliday junction DNA helicase RuvA
MIALVAGQVAVRRPDHVVLETASGVGYRLNVSSETLRHVPAAGGTVSLHAHLVVREDALTLYGFAAEAERDLFLLLLGVQAVGPKVAQAILGTGTARELVGAVVAGDAKAFQAAPGVGKRTAERIIVELRDKVGEEAPAADLDVLPRGAEVSAARGDDPRLLARDGLVELGFTLPEAVAMLAGVEGDSAEELLAQALRGTRS